MKKQVKYTQGFVKQTFDQKGKLISSEFKATSEVEWVDENDIPINPYPKDLYYPFDMVQPQ